MRRGGIGPPVFNLQAVADEEDQSTTVRSGLGVYIYHTQTAKKMVSTKSSTSQLLFLNIRKYDTRGVFLVLLGCK